MVYFFACSVCIKIIQDDVLKEPLCGFAESKDVEKESEEKSMREYVLFTYYIPKAVNKWIIDFVVIWNCELYIKVCPVEVY